MNDPLQTKRDPVALISCIQLEITKQATGRKDSEMEGN
jgi:hypothetical protein